MGNRETQVLPCRVYSAKMMKLMMMAHLRSWLFDSLDLTALQLNFADLLARGSYLHHQSHPTLVHFAHLHIPKSAS